jgi:hypothetical protein
VACGRTPRSRERAYAGGVRRVCGGKVVGVAGWPQNRNAAAREGVAKRSGRFARRGERGGGGSRSRTRRGASEARRGRGDCARSAQFASGRAKTPAQSENALAAGRRMPPTLARRAATRSARVGAALAAVRGPAHGQRAGRRWRWRGPERSEGRGAPHPHGGAEPDSARRRASPEWRRGRARASEG